MAETTVINLLFITSSESESEKKNSDFLLYFRLNYSFSLKYHKTQ